MQIAVIGAGASGLMVSGKLTTLGHEVTLFEKNEKVGKKLFITGKGRCNLTNLCDNEEFLSNVVRGNKFLRSALNHFSSYDCYSFFEELGLNLKVERGNRVFPFSDKSNDVIKTLEKFCKNVNIKYNTEVFDIVKKEDKFDLATSRGVYSFDKVIVSTGGKSYSLTGSTGKGYEFAKKFGHNIIDLKPSLVAIELKDNFVPKLQGLSLKNVEISCLNRKFNFFGEMLFTDKGISGPIVLSLSSYINRLEVDKIFLDFKPALDKKQLEQRLLREFDENKNKNIYFIYKGLFPSKLADVFGDIVGVKGDRKVNSITKLEREKIIEYIKNFPLNFKKFYSLDTAIVTSGGVSLDEINPKTFQSKLCQGLYFIGEVLDIDALTGGFNLQIAFATAMSCADNLE